MTKAASLFGRTAIHRHFGGLKETWDAIATEQGICQRHGEWKKNAGMTFVSTGLIQSIMTAQFWN